MDLLLKRGRFLFFLGVLLFFPGVAYFGLFVALGNDTSVFTNIGLGLSGLLVIVGLPLLLLAGAVLFKNRRTIWFFPKIEKNYNESCNFF